MHLAVMTSIAGNEISLVSEFKEGDLVKKYKRGQNTAKFLW